MSARVIQVADDFWNIRGSFRIGGLIDIGTQASLVRRANGKFVFLDSYMLTAAAEREIDELTGGGKDVEAVLNVHPFHTVHARAMHDRYPHARHYGTARHLARFSDLDWEEVRTEDHELHAAFAEDFEFSLPRGVDFISANENVHFSSVLVFHTRSKTIHVDDTFMYIRLPLVMRWFGLINPLSFHPTLAKALEKRAGAAREFRQWAEELLKDWRAAENLCAAHTATLTARKNRGAPLGDRLGKALDKVRHTLTAHEKKFG